MLGPGGGARLPTDVHTVYRSYAPRLVMRVRQVFGLSEDDAFDVVQRVVIEYWRKPPDIHTSLMAWLWRCCAREALNHLRRRGARARLVERFASDLAASGPLADFIEGEAHVHADFVRFVMDHFPDRDVELIVHVWIMGLTQEEAGAVVGIGERQVRNVLRRLEERLWHLRPAWTSGRFRESNHA